MSSLEMDPPNTLPKIESPAAPDVIDGYVFRQGLLGCRSPIVFRRAFWIWIFLNLDLATDTSGSSASAISGTFVMDSSASRNINLGASNRSTRSLISTTVAANVQSSHPLHAKFQQQQQSMNARSKNPSSSNGIAYPEHLINSSSSMAAKVPTSLILLFPSKPATPIVVVVVGAAGAGDEDGIGGGG
ncbi:hypothetical protein QVD17_31366 [Tagetes erecta]|uniref:Uncharacterized protein n=1 Tax=Tagetes erecta TaxID=13708 RepID=A0AAD8K5F7_TARER|nr:hypothetical protein QVD17_31366 [Tagetes erecta]